MEQTPDEVLINGLLYNVKGFKHPGGSVMKYHMGHGDATEAFTEFHSRSPKAHKLLATLPNRPAPPAPATVDETRRARMSATFAALRKQLELEGWFNPSPSHTLLRLTELLVMHVAGIWLVLQGYYMAGIAVLGITQGRFGWLMHEGGHFSMTGIPKIDTKFQEFLFGYGCGMSGAWWRIQHNKHHAMPQKMHRDVDLDTLPLVAFNKAVVDFAKSSRFQLLWLSLQGLLFAPVTTCLVALSWQLFLHPRHIIRTKRYFEAFSIAIRYAVFYWLAQTVGASVSSFIAAAIFYDFCGGCYIFCNFALSHTHLAVAKEDDNVHWLEYASVHTMNVTPNPLVNWWMGYLNFQIEHHLFPTMPQYRFVKLAPRIKKLFEQNGLKYDCRGYWEAVGYTFRNLHNVGN